MSKGILVYCEVREGAFKGINRELISAAAAMSQAGAGPVSVAVLGDGVDAAVEEAKSYPVEKVYAVKSPALGAYSTQGYATALAAVIEQSGAGVVLFGATAMGKDLSARMAARCGACLFTDCTELSWAAGALTVKRPVYSGKVYAEMVGKGDLQMASIRPNTYAGAQPGGGAEVVDLAVDIADGDISGRVKELVSAGSGRKDLTEAEIIVAGGRSLKSGENFQILEDMADVLGGSVGATRAAVDAGYVPHAIQVGQTGKVVNPKLYIALGVSGAIQHLVGMRTSKVIVAVNKDDSAPIFQKADYGIVGDLFDLAPLITQEFKALLG